MNLLLNLRGSDSIPENQGQEEEEPKPCVARPTIIATTDAEPRAENARLHAKKQELEAELGSVKADFHNRGLVNQLREIIKDHRRTEKKLKDTIHNANRFANSLRKDYKYAKRGIQSLREEVNVLRSQWDRL